MVSSRTLTALVGLGLSLAVSVVLWVQFDTLVAFLFLPFVPFLFRGGDDARERPPVRRCPVCDYRTRDPEFTHCPRDGTPLEREDGAPVAPGDERQRRVGAVTPTGTPKGDSADAPGMDGDADAAGDAGVTAADGEATGGETSDDPAPGPYEAVLAHPDGESTPARYAETAADHGFAGVVVRNHDAVAGTDHAAVDRVREATGVDVVDAVTVRADDPSQASGHVGNYRPKATLLLVAGGSPALNRFAVEEERVDVLTRPMAGGGDFNHVLANAAAEHGVRVEFDLSRVLRLSGGQRVQALQDLRKLRELVDACDAPFVVSAAPESHLQVRSPRELRAVGEAVGFDAAAVAAGLREWGRLAARNRERQSESFIEPGVRRGRYEETD